MSMKLFRAGSPAGAGHPRSWSLRAAVLGGVALVMAGLMGVPAATPAAAASFDCATATARDERAVCVNRELSDLDVRMATLYEVLTHLVAMGQRGQLQDQQKAFLAFRATCGGRVSCIRGAYRNRIAQLETGLQAIYARGPF